MKRKKTVWFEVGEHESIDECLQRMNAEGYGVSGKIEEPLFQEINGEIKPIGKIIKFKGTLVD